MSLIEWTDDGYPTEASLERLREALRDEDITKAIDAFYEALRENHWPDWCGPERVEVRGEVIDVWAYHTGGWSGNEDIIGVLQESWLWDWLLERYDAGGHYYFKPRSAVLPNGERHGQTTDRQLPSPDSPEPRPAPSGHGPEPRRSRAGAERSGAEPEAPAKPAALDGRGGGPQDGAPGGGARAVMTDDR